MRRVFALVLLSIVFAAATFADETQKIRFGVFAYMGKEKTKAQYEPLVKQLSESLKVPIELEVLTHEEMVAKVAKDELDIITTNATNYLLFRQRYHLSGALATLLVDFHSRAVSCLSGVMVARSESSMRSLKDLKSKTIITPSMKRMGGFRAQAYELYKNSINITKEAKEIIETKGSHTQAIKELLENPNIDAAFVRSGTIESMIDANDLDRDSIYILNQKEHKNFPFLSSTELYPEWPIFAMSHVDSTLLRKFVAALYLIEPDDLLIKNSGIYGFTVPAEYTQSEALAKALKLPPFENFGEINIKDILLENKISVAVVLFLFMLIVVIYISSLKSFRKNRLLLENMGDGVYGIDDNGLCTWVNPKALELLGFSKEELLYKDQHMVFHHHTPSGEEYKHQDCPIYKTLRDKKTRELEEHFIKKDGSFLPVSLTVAALRNERGAIVIFRDISKMKEERQKLQEASERVELIINASHIGLWEFEMQADTIFWDRHAFAMLGYEESEFSLSFGVWLEMMHPDDREKTQKSLEKQLSKGDSFRLEYRLRHKNGSWFWIDGRGEVVERNADNTPAKMVGIHIDYNAQKETELALTQESQKAQIANRAKSQFLANMSHEIRTPMNAIIGLGTLLEEMGLSEKQRDILHKINSSSKMLLKILNDILDYSKIEAGKFELEHHHFKLEDVTSQLELMFSDSASSKGLAFELYRDERLPLELYGDELRLVQVLVNLVSNALKFTAKGSVEVRVSLESSVDQNRARISFCVRDTGIGMSKEQSVRLFEAFMQADSSTTRKYGGTGLGLVISKNILKAMNSEIEVESREKEGTSVSFEIEFEVAAWSDKSRDPQKPQSNRVSIESLRGAYVLVVEDNALNQEVAKLILHNIGVEVDIANNGAEGVERYFDSKEKYDAILMDLQMPIMGGYEASEKIRQRDKDIPIIALTAAALVEDREKVLESGMNDHLAKPIDKEALYSVLLKHIKEPKRRDNSSDKSEFTLALEEMQAQLRGAAFMEYEYLEDFYKKAHPFIKQSTLTAFREAVESFEFEKALEILELRVD